MPGFKSPLRGKSLRQNSGASSERHSTTIRCSETYYLPPPCTPPGSASVYLFSRLCSKGSSIVDLEDSDDENDKKQEEEKADKALEAKPTAVVEGSEKKIQ